jgi:hypothetical protein
MEDPSSISAFSRFFFLDSSSTMTAGTDLRSSAERYVCTLLYDIVVCSVVVFSFWTTLCSATVVALYRLSHHNKANFIFKL